MENNEKNNNEKVKKILKKKVYIDINFPLSNFKIIKL